MVKRKLIRRLTGWGTKGRPFSQSEFNRSYIKKNIHSLSYSRYLMEVSKSLRSKNRRKRESIKIGMK